MLRNSLRRVLPILAVVAVSISLMGCPPAEVGERGSMNRGSNLTVPRDPEREPEPPVADDSESDEVQTTGLESETASTES